MKALEKNIAIEGRHLVKDFNPGGAATKVLKDVSLQIAQGEFASIMGPSGSGKSTLLYILGGLDTPTSGSVLLNGTDISRFDDEKMSRIRRQKIGFVFQFYNLIPNLSVEENILLPLLLDGRKKQDYKSDLEYILEVVGLSHRRRHTPRELSGGQQQRVAIARALASEAPVILADEPTGNLDEDTAQDITEILKESAHKMNKCVVVVTHSNELAKQADVVFRLRKGELQVLERVQDGAAQPQSRRNNAPRSERRAK